ncbi:MAG TPA: class F sortase [Candidatus Saccharimonadales bacterium]|nr:class F sortase [Candidatus Saccharimonadales bacterium]
MKNNLLLVIILVGSITGIIFGSMLTHTTSHAKQQVEAILAQEQKQLPTPDPTPRPSVPPGIPLTITIPKIHVSAAVESVKMDAQGRMDIPKRADDTAWYSPGYKPGMNGSAVIDGHLDKVTGAPAVFWNLKLLSVGDHILVSENNDRKYIFAVSRIVRYPYNNFPIQEVFGASQTPMLNLITCNGVWDKNTKNYSDRLVVYSTLVAQN